MRAELVVRRGWVSEQELLVLVLSWAYVRYGTTDVGAGVLYGIKPVVIAIIASAIVGLARIAVRTRLLAAVAVASLVGYFLGLSPLAILFGGACLVAVVENRDRWQSKATVSRASVVVPILMAKLHLGKPAGGTSRLTRASLAAIFFEFLKLGSIVFGSGYVLVSYLHSDLVRNNHWLTQSQLLVTVAIGQVTPGPVFTTATSIGYVVGGVGGALLATVGIFLPSFVLVAAVMPLLSRARRSRWPPVPSTE
jgi:chromate transporter